MQNTQTNFFLDRFSKSGIDRDPQEVCSIIQENIIFISKNAFTTSFINGDKIKDVIPLSLNIKNLKFVPQNYGFVQQMIPLFFIKVLAWECDDRAINIQHFFDFLCNSLPELSHLQIEENEKKEHSTFTTFILKNSKEVHYGLIYLSEYYRLNHKSEEQVFSCASKAFDCLSAACALVEKSQSVFSTEKAFHLLDYENYAPLKTLMKIRKNSFSKPFIEKKVETRNFDFFRTCLQMKEEELKKFCSKLETILTSNKGVNKSDCLFAELLSDPRFSSMHSHCLINLLRKKKILEKQEQFEQRANNTQVKMALDYVKNKIVELKSKPEKEKLLLEFLDHKGELAHLVYYKPFQNIFNFMFHHFDTPKIENYHRFPHPMPLHLYSKFIINVLLNVSDFNTIDFTSQEGRMILLQSIEFMFLDTSWKDFHKDELKSWVKCYPEISQFPKIKAVIDPLLQD